MNIQVREDPAASHGSTSLKPLRLLGWFVVDTDAPIGRMYLNTDGQWRGCAAQGWWRTKEEAEAAADRAKNPDAYSITALRLALDTMAREVAFHRRMNNHPADCAAPQCEVRMTSQNALCVEALERTRQEPPHAQ